MATQTTVQITMPAMGESVTEGTILQWLVGPGDAVEADETVVEVSTDKVDTEVPTPVPGTIARILVGVDETVPVGTVLAEIDVSGAPAAVSANGAALDGATLPSEGAPPAEGAGTEAEIDGAGERGEGPVAPAGAEAAAARAAGEEAAARGGPAAAIRGAGAPTGNGAHASDEVVELVDVALPAMGESVTEGTVLEWHKQVGDAVAEGETVLEVSTDKVDTEIPSPVAGKLLEISVSEDETVEVGAVLALIGTAGEAPAEQESPPPAGDAADEDTSAAAEEPAQEETGG